MRKKRMRYYPLLPFILIINFTISLSQVQVEIAFPNLTFNKPVDLQYSPDGSNRLFVVEQAGMIWVFDNESNVMNKDVFLDIRDRVSYGGERGLLGLAFHPNYADSGYFYVNYTGPNLLRTVISRFRVSANDPNSADVNSEFNILEIQQPFSNHNGGQILFGPEGYLYIGMGDGGAGGDPYGHGQNLQTLLGTLLRIDIDNPEGNLNYGIPPDNPFAGNPNGYREEIFAYGLRNPWRFSFDPVTEWLWVADVGQDEYEEIDIVSMGGNYGWNIMEGLHCYYPPTNCDTTGLTLPIWEYDHSVGKSITGGYVYRGMRVPLLYGKYIYADFEAGTVWALEYDGANPPVNTELLQMGAYTLTSFGIDENRELFLCSFDGNLYRLSQDNSVDYTISHLQGWNLVGLPLEVADASYLSLFPNAIENTLYSFDGSYLEATELTAGEGYWLNFQDEGFSTIYGIFFNAVAIPLQMGWNLISGVSTSVPVNNIIDPAGIMIPGTIYEFDGFYAQTGLIEPGKGYWVNASNEGEIIISSGRNEQTENSGNFSQKIAWKNRLETGNGLTFTNAKGYSTKLYFGISVPEGERFSYSLPPAPPSAEAFDVRFVGDWLYTEESGLIEVRNTEYPLTIFYDVRNTPVEGVIKWMLENSLTGESYVLAGSGELVISSPVKEFRLNKHEILPGKYTLYQNYPNPFNPETTITFEIPQEGRVEVVILDVLGREVGKPLDDWKEAGFHQVVWNANGNGNGIYFFRLTVVPSIPYNLTNNSASKLESFFQETKKMILLK